MPEGCVTLLYVETRPAYEPLDELLQEPTIQILRALARLEWCTARDLFLAIDIPLDRDSEISISNSSDACASAAKSSVGRPRR